MSNSCSHRFDKVTRHPTRGSEIASGTCANCNVRLCVHDFLDPRNLAAAISYRFAHPLSSVAVSGCLICQGNPRANTFEQRRLFPWFDGEGPALPAGWQFVGKSNEGAPTTDATPATDAAPTAT